MKWASVRRGLFLALICSLALSGLAFAGGPDISASATLTITPMSNYGVSFTAAQIQSGLTAFFAMAGAAALLVGILALRVVPKVVRAVFSLTGRR